jgi:hypothetical protein
MVKSKGVLWAFTLAAYLLPGTLTLSGSDPIITPSALKELHPDYVEGSAIVRGVFNTQLTRRKSDCEEALRKRMAGYDVVPAQREIGIFAFVPPLHPGAATPSTISRMVVCGDPPPDGTTWWWGCVDFRIPMFYSFDCSYSCGAEWYCEASYACYCCADGWVVSPQLCNGCKRAQMCTSSYCP